MLELMCSQFFKRCFEGENRALYLGKEHNIYKYFSFYSGNIPIQPLDLIILQSKTNQFSLAKYVQKLTYICSFVKRTELVTAR